MDEQLFEPSSSEIHLPFLELGEQPTLTTDRLVIRPVSEADVPSIFAYASNPNITRYTLWEHHQTFEDTRRFVIDYASLRQSEGVPDPMAICLKETPEYVIGTIGCFWANRPSQTMEMGYALGENYWNHGYITEAARSLVDYVFESYRVERLQARAMIENVGSRMVLEKVGFRCEGIARRALYHRGIFRDLALYSIIRPDRRS